MFEECFLTNKLNHPLDLPTPYHFSSLLLLWQTFRSCPSSTQVQRCYSFPLFYTAPVSTGDDSVVIFLSRATIRVVVPRLSFNRRVRRRRVTVFLGKLRWLIAMLTASRRSVPPNRRKHSFPPCQFPIYHVNVDKRWDSHILLELVSHSFRMQPPSLVIKAD